MVAKPYYYRKKQQTRAVSLVCMMGWVGLSLSLPLAFAFHLPKVGASRVTTQRTQQTPNPLFQRTTASPQRPKLLRFLPLFSSSSPEANPKMGDSSAMTAPSIRVVNGASSEEVVFEGTTATTTAVAPPKTSLLESVRKASNFASILCALDCTLLPLVTVVLPLLGLLELSPARLALLDQLGHSLALYFVLPVGTVTTAFNYVSHRKAWISAMAVVGMTLVGVANAHFHHLPDYIPSMVATAVHNMQSCGCHPSIWHRLSNVGGCALLLGSNYLSQKQDGCAAHSVLGSSNSNDDEGGSCCGHSHSHDHKH